MEYQRNEQSEETKWYVYDGLGSVLSEVDEDGNVGVARSYHAFGAVRSSVGVSESKSGFVGSLGHALEADATGGLIYMRARWYDPAIGRFISEDPACDGVNWYAYCENNPLSRIDGNGCEDIDLNWFINVCLKAYGEDIGDAGTAINAIGKVTMGIGFAQFALGLKLWTVGQALAQAGMAIAEMPGVCPAAVVLHGYGRIAQVVGGRSMKRGMANMVIAAALIHYGNLIKCGGSELAEAMTEGGTE